MKAFLCVSVITLWLRGDSSFAKGNASTETRRSLRDANDLFYFLMLISRVVAL
jgi:hypothetical protein